MTHADEIVAFALSQDGDSYVFGAEASPDDVNPDAFDCSELVQWACARAALDPTMPDGSWWQARHCRNHDTLITLDEALRTRGALLFKFSSTPFEGGRPSSAHVAISLGNGLTIEARSSTYGVGMFTAEDRGWTHAGLIPGAQYGFRDPDSWAVPDWEWAMDAGVMTEHSDPHKHVQKQELAAHMRRLARYINGGNT